MKILTATLHAIDNCGSCLQAYALQQYLLQQGIENEIIDYRPPYFKNNGNTLKYFIKKIVFGRKIREREQIFEQFVVEYLKVTSEQYKTYEEVEKADLQADYFLTGSDQVWNDYFPCGRDPFYYLDFAKQGKKISYAASLGRVPDERELQQLYNRVKDFDFISVREESSMLALHEKGLQVEQVCDPTLLWDKDFYDKIAVQKEIGDYILVYLTAKSELLDDVLEKLQEKYQCKIVYVGSFLNRCKCDVNYTNVGPREFLGLIAGAKFVVAGSFHATIFSCIYQKEFAVLPYKNNERMRDLLKKLKLEERYIENFDKIGESIEWGKIGLERQSLREKSEKIMRLFMKK